MSANYNLLTNAYKDGYEQGFKAGQASRTPIKWPDERTISDAAREYSLDSSDTCHYVDFKAGVQWLKSFVEKDKSE